MKAEIKTVDELKQKIEALTQEIEQKRSENEKMAAETARYKEENTQLKESQEKLSIAKESTDYVESLVNQANENTNGKMLVAANQKLQEKEKENQALVQKVSDLQNELSQARTSGLSDDQKEKLLKESLVEHEKKWKQQEEEKLAKIQNEFKTVEKQI